MAQLWIAVSVVQNAAKAISALNTLRNFERSINESAVENLVFLWQQLECMNEPLKVLLAHQCREVTMAHVDAAVRLARKSIRVVEEFLAPDIEEVQRAAGTGGSAEDDDEETKSSLQVCREWLSKKKDGKEKKEQIPEISDRLQKTLVVMQLGMSTVGSVVPEALRVPRSPFMWRSSVYDSAVRMQVELMRGGAVRARAVAAGLLWEENAAVGMWVCKGRSAVVLQEDEEQAGWVLEGRAAPESSLKDDDRPVFEGSIMLPLKNLKVTRCWGEEVQQMVHRSIEGASPEAVLYSLSDGDRKFALQFEAVDKVDDEPWGRTVTAELFETLLFLFRDTQQSEHQVRTAVCEALQYFTPGSEELAAHMAALTLRGP